MSGISTKMLQAAAGAGGEALAIEDVFSTYLYTGSGSTNQSITNGIDLSNEGGLVWIKRRDSTSNHYLVNTERGALKFLSSNLNSAEDTTTPIGVNAFNTDGFDVDGNASNFNATGADYASWTFRKAPRFFDVVTYTGTSSAQTIAHSLGVAPGMIICKPTSGTGNWAVWHRSNGNNNVLYLNLTNSNGLSNTVWNNTAPTADVFSVGNSGATNGNGVTYVAYLFAHDPLGPSGDGSDGLISCGSFSTDGSAIGQDVDIGWEPQWLLVKRSSAVGDWRLIDTMRGYPAYEPGNNATQRLEAEDNAAEATQIFGGILSGRGFKIQDSSNSTYIYIAIRRGPMRAPESGTEVFAPAITYDEVNNPGFNSGFVTDVLLWRRPTATDEMRFFSRLNQGKRLRFDSSLGEASDANQPFDFNDGVDAPTNDTARGWLWKRAPQFCDVVCYTGTGSTQNISHNLGVAPEMMWVKRRDNTDMWKAYHLGTGNTKYTRMDGSFDGTQASVTSSTTWNNTTPSDTTFTVGTASDVNGSGNTYIATLFTSLEGVSKVGSYTGNGSSQTIDCGFTSGARFVLIKRTDSTGDWYLWDTVRGIVAANDPHVSLNSSAAEVTTDDSIDPDSSGFIVNQVAATNINVSSAEYIFYAIA